MNDQEDQEVNRLLVWLAANAPHGMLCYSREPEGLVYVVKWRMDSDLHDRSAWKTTRRHQSPREALKAAKKLIEEKNT